MALIAQQPAQQIQLRPGISLKVKALNFTIIRKAPAILFNAPDIIRAWQRITDIKNYDFQDLTGIMLD